MRTSRRIVLPLSLALCALQGAVGAEDVLLTKAGDTGLVDRSLANEAKAAIDRGTQWLISRQSSEGYWSNAEFPALTALPVWALVKAGVRDARVLDPAVKYIVSCARDNGAIYRDPTEDRKGGGLSTYNTAICMVALHEVGDAELTPLVLKAREFVAKSQHLGGDLYRGGMGYDPSSGKPYADLSNSYMGYEAMRLTESAEDFRAPGAERTDLDWEAAVEFLDRVQNLPGGDDQPWETEAPDEKGGFIYRPDASQAGTYTDEKGVVRFRTYGSMTYAGLLSLIYSQVDRDDPRVRSAFDWTTRHWSLDENPGMGQEGLYYFYNVISKGLAAYGQNPITLTSGQMLNWRTELIRKLIALQKVDPETGHGYWVNESGRWWEADPVLVTSYSLLALEVALE
ncbi:MAG: cycloartenol synthase [Kiritimatiellae bacterium]|nr:cycloartenol synthase [Kiritimatiellia bacterium]